MHGVSEVIAIILILMITISLAGLAYMFMSTTMADVTSSAGSTVDTTTSSMLTSFTIESMDVAKVYVRNTGQNALTSLSVYVNDELATYNVTTPIASGAVGTITIYSFIPDGATVKVTSPSGFSTSKVARPCEKAVGCWKFDEGSGTSAFDSSPYSNTGTLTNGPTWTSGKYGNGIQFDGTNDILFWVIKHIESRTSITLSAMSKFCLRTDGRIYHQKKMRLLLAYTHQIIYILSLTLALHGGF
jgi:flagellin-like protein